MGIEVLKELEAVHCLCGKEHSFTSDVVLGKGAIRQLPEVLAQLGVKRPYVVADQNTWQAAGQTALDLLNAAGITVQYYVFCKDPLEPDETNTGLAFMHYPESCDVVIAVGSGVINDICKIVAAVSGKPYVIVATAPSMDGYASATSSMAVDGLKRSLNSKCADVIIGDTDILCNAPIKTMLSGLGDMLAKYVSICEWRIAALVAGDYYCENIAALVRTALKRCVDNADGLLARDPAAVEAVFEGLVISGVAMNYAGVSRPASGVEHYFSHIWDMRGLSFDLPVETHGIQCAVGTLIAAKLYEKIVKLTPDKAKALAYVQSFDLPAWHETLRSFLGKSADAMIALEEKERKYDLQKHSCRLEIILNNWDTILQIIREELPPAETLERLMDKLGMPKTLPEIGVDADLLEMTFKSTKDIRNKYVLSHLCWDLGIIDEIL